MYTKAVDIPKFFKGIGVAQEVSRDTDKSTVCRVILGSNSNYKAIFFNVNKSREKPTNIDAIEESELAKPNSYGEINLSQLSDTAAAAGGGWFSSKPKTASAPITSTSTPSKSLVKIGGEVAEDRRMTMQAFNTLIQQMVPIQGNLCPQKGQMSNPFNNQIMPDLSCPGAKFGGKRRHKTTKKNKKFKKRNTRNKRKY
jgi:hypothetical protein